MAELIDARWLLNGDRFQCWHSPGCRVHSAQPLPLTWPLKDARRLALGIRPRPLVPGQDRCLFLYRPYWAGGPLD